MATSKNRKTDTPPPSPFTLPRYHRWKKCCHQNRNIGSCYYICKYFDGNTWTIFESLYAIVGTNEGINDGKLCNKSKIYVLIESNELRFPSSSELPGSTVFKYLEKFLLHFH